MKKKCKKTALCQLAPALDNAFLLASPSQALTSIPSFAVCRTCYPGREEEAQCQQGLIFGSCPIGIGWQLILPRPFLGPAITYLRVYECFYLLENILFAWRWRYLQICRNAYRNFVSRSFTSSVVSVKLIFSIYVDAQIPYPLETLMTLYVFYSDLNNRCLQPRGISRTKASTRPQPVVCPQAPTMLLSSSISTSSRPCNLACSPSRSPSLHWCQ